VVIFPSALFAVVFCAVKIVFKRDFLDEKLNQKNYELVLALIMDLKPRDTAEAMPTAQYATLHLKAMKAMPEDNYYIMGKVLMMFRLSQQALNMLQVYRGKSQTINVNYNVLNQGNATMNTQIQAAGH
jgi:hypothetical protein